VQFLKLLTITVVSSIVFPIVNQQAAELVNALLIHQFWTQCTVWTFSYSRASNPGVHCAVVNAFKGTTNLKPLSWAVDRI